MSIILTETEIVPASGSVEAAEVKVREPMLDIGNRVCTAHLVYKDSEGNVVDVSGHGDVVTTITITNTPKRNKQVGPEILTPDENGKIFVEYNIIGNIAAYDVTDPENPVIMEEGIDYNRGSNAKVLKNIDSDVTVSVSYVGEVPASKNFNDCFKDLVVTYNGQEMTLYKLIKNRIQEELVAKWIIVGTATPEDEEDENGD